MRRALIAVLLLLSTCNDDKAELAIVCEVDSDCGDGAICTARRSDSVIPQCTAGCVSDQECVAVFGEGQCFVECFLPCDDDSACPAQTGCQNGTCVPLCSSDNDCQPGLSCSATLCH